MSSRGREPGNPESAPVESRRAPAATDVGGVTPAGDGGVTPDEFVTEDGEGSVIDAPNMGEFSAEAARPTPLDDIAEAERTSLPED